MSRPATRDERGIYGRFWDYYVDEVSAKQDEDTGQRWPGDEWGSAEAWQARFDDLFPPAGVEHWHKAVEIGPGSGKYTTKVLEASATDVRAYDVSERFLSVCAERCRGEIDSGRLSLHPLHAVDPAQLLDDLRAAGWQRNVDGFFAIDVMVHIDLQYLIVYWITAGLVLRPGGRLVMTLNDVTREPGFDKLVGDVAWTFPSQGRALGSGKFEWLSPDIVTSILPRLGFRIAKLSEGGRDLHVIAELEDVERTDALEVHLRPRN